MRKIALNHWYVKDNELRISLSRFHVSIGIDKNIDGVSYPAEVVDSHAERVLLNFYTLEEAIYFTEDVIRSCKNNKVVLEEYLDWFNKVYGNDDEYENIFLSPDEIETAIIRCFGSDKDYKVSVREEVLLDEEEVNYYLIEHLEDETVETKLTDNDLKEAFNLYLEDYNYDTESFNFVINFDGQNSYFDGAELKVNEIEDYKVLKREM